MKHHLSIYCCILFLTMGMAASCNSYKKKAPAQPQQAQEQPVQAAPASRLLTDSLLPQSVDLEQDINGLGYEELRILRSYPYALHGYWFIEGDLNNFFCRKTDWYYDLCEKTLYESYEKNLIYADTYDKVELLPEEKSFRGKDRPPHGPTRPTQIQNKGRTQTAQLLPLCQPFPNRKAQRKVPFNVGPL